MTMTLKEIYQALLNGETLKNKITKNKVRMGEKYLVNEKGERADYIFASPEDWEIYKDPKDDPKQWVGKICWFWDGDEGDANKYLGLLERYYANADTKCPFMKKGSVRWQHCRPLTREEAEQYLVKEN